jgi:lysophospholipase L1-like esterase
MNDGQYRPYAEDIGRAYESNMRRSVAAMEKAGVKTMVLGSPGVVDTKYFRNGNFGAQPAGEGYNQNLGKLRDINKRIAPELGQLFADVHQPMLDAMAKAKAAYGEDYDVGGRDGVHPSANGHLIMAYAFLRGLGCDGSIGEITLDMNGAAKVSAGHKVAGGSGAQVEIESTRYPFCFDSDPKASHSTRSITPFFPFNQDLNRLVLKVKNLNTPKAKVTWGEESKEFTREELTAGVNLAAEFSKTPFDNNFRQILDAIGKKQNFETSMIKGMVTNFRNFANDAKNDPQLAGAFETLGKRLQARQEELDAAVRKLLVPVTHKISVTVQ